ncbi:hypothetical protein B9Z19DRAFT_1067958 [Tuber borchii]|uniref:Uncharacterized protein n=1 Tax=Tuber borchii TaxID=42251 RepID=A0A2T6ZH39_TUBBO|nr:hypothetical protein B9Z19DRAFT_1067958 [Tuber borchii]
MWGKLVNVQHNGCLKYTLSSSYKYHPSRNKSNLCIKTRRIPYFHLQHVPVPQYPIPQNTQTNQLAEAPKYNPILATIHKSPLPRLSLIRMPHLSHFFLPPYDLDNLISGINPIPRAFDSSSPPPLRPSTIDRHPEVQYYSLNSPISPFTTLASNEGTFVRQETQYFNAS